VDRAIPILCAQRAVSQQTGGSLRDALNLMHATALGTPATVDDVARAVLDGSLQFGPSQECAGAVTRP